MAIKLLKIGSANIVVDAIASIGGNGLIQLATDQSNGASNYSTLKKAGVAYQVTSGKTLYIVGGLLSSASSNGTFTPGYGTAIVSNSASAPAGDAKSADAVTIQAVTVGAQVIPLWLVFPALSYPYFKNASVLVTGILWGFEE